MVERCIQTFKQMMKVDYDKEDLYLYKLEYETTPIDSNIPSLEEMLFNRKINSLLPKFNASYGYLNNNTRKYLLDRQLKPWRNKKQFL